MPITPDELLYSVIDDAAFELATAANASQMQLDAFIERNALVEQAVGIEELLSGRVSSVPAGIMAAYEKLVARIMGTTTFRAFGDGKAQALADGGAKGEDVYQWNLGSSKGGPCPDCVARAGRQEPLAYWAAVGMPQSGFSVCGGKCHCHITEVKK